MTTTSENLQQRASNARAVADDESNGNGNGGVDDRLLQVIRAGSIKELRTRPTDKVHVWPHLLLMEFVASLVVFGFVVVFSIFVNAPFQELADPNKTPNPAKAPWYFIGLQELLTYFNPMVAGVLGPGMAATGLIMLPFLDKNPSTKPEDRKFAVTFFTVFLMFWATLSIIGALFRGKGFQFILPWDINPHFDL